MCVYVCVFVGGSADVSFLYIPLSISPPSLDKNYIIAACDLIFLKKYFEVSSFGLCVSSESHLF